LIFCELLLTDIPYEWLLTFTFYSAPKLTTAVSLVTVTTTTKSMHFKPLF